MTAQYKSQKFNEDEAQQSTEVLYHLMDQDYFIISNPELEFAALIAGHDTQTTNGSQVPFRRQLVEKLYLQNLLSLSQHGKILRYDISSKGRELAERLQNGDVEAILPYLTPPKSQEPPSKSPIPRGNLENNETPIRILARKRDKYGHKYLTARMVAAADRLREDFEIGEIDPQVTRDWDDFIAQWREKSFDVNSGTTSPNEAKARWAAAMHDMGAGLSDIAFRVCCNLEGLETAEELLGWSARSGKIVLRIALIHLADFYQIPEFRER